MDRPRKTENGRNFHFTYSSTTGKRDVARKIQSRVPPTAADLKSDSAI